MVLTAGASCSRAPIDKVVCSDGEAMNVFQPRPIGKPLSAAPLISHVQVVDLDGDSLLDVVVCDCRDNSVSWIRQEAPNQFSETVLAQNLVAPAHAHCADVDQDGDLDIAVAVLGKLFPTNDKIGALILLEHLPDHSFSPHTILSETARVSDVRSGDIDGDGDLDLAVTQFGYTDGKFGWLRNNGGWNFEYAPVQQLEGGIHGILEDMNGDGNLDAVVLISQDYERVYMFEGDGKGNFKENLIHQADTNEFGSSGIWIEDLDLDGSQDIIFTNGDAFDYSPPHPWPWHGVQWLKNTGNGKFDFQHLTDLGGASCAAVTDFDQDGDVDIFVGSTFNDWDDPTSASLIFLENNGDMTFVKRTVSNTPTHIQSIAVADINGDGKNDLISGCMHVFEPYDRVQRIQLWSNTSGE